MHLSFYVAYIERGPVMSVNNNMKKYSSSKDLHLMHLSFYVAYIERGPVMSVNNNMKKYSSSKDLHLMHLSFYVTYLKCRPVMSIFYIKRQMSVLCPHFSQKPHHQF